MDGDSDVGGPSSFSDDDAWFDIENDMVYQWDHDNWSTSYGGFRPAYFGWSFLESPGNPHDGIDNDGDGMIYESQFDGIDNDGDWDPERDDIGADGLGEYHINYTGPDEDGTEGNRIWDDGEEEFIDSNGNGVYEPAENYIDSNFENWIDLFGSILR